VNPILPPAVVPTPSASPSQRIRLTISKPPILRALSVYILTSILISTSHIVFGRVFQSASRGSDHFGIFVKSRYSPPILESTVDSPLSFRKHPYYLNGRFLFLFMAQITLAMSFHFRNILLDRSTVRWTHGQVCPFQVFTDVTLSLPLTGSEDGSYDPPFTTSLKHWHHYLWVHNRHIRSIHSRLWARACRCTPYTIPDSVGFASTSTFPWPLYTWTMEPPASVAESCTCLAKLFVMPNHDWWLGICRVYV
jgi:hypothetical protein